MLTVSEFNPVARLMAGRFTLVLAPDARLPVQTNGVCGVPFRFSVMVTVVKVAEPKFLSVTTGFTVDAQTNPPFAGVRMAEIPASLGSGVNASQPFEMIRVFLSAEEFSAAYNLVNRLWVNRSKHPSTA